MPASPLLRTLAVLALAAVPGLAWGKSWKPWFDQAGSLELQDVVELPLLQPDVAAPVPAVRVSIDNQPTLAILDPGLTGIYVSEAFAKAVGAKPEDESLGALGERKVARLPDISIGSAVIEGPRAFVGGGPLKADLVIGLGTFPGVAGVVLASQGVLRIGPSSAAGELLGALVGGTELAAAARPPEVIELLSGTPADGKAKVVDQVTTGLPLVVQGTVAGSAAEVALAYTASGAVARGLVAGRKPLLTRNTNGLHAVEVAVGDVKLGEVGVVEDTALDLGTRPAGAVLGGATLMDWDLAWDGQGKVVVKDGVTVAVRASFAPVAVEEARRALTPAEGEAPTGRAAAPLWLAVADAELWNANEAGAREALQQALAQDPGSCTVLQAWGRHLLRVEGESAEAVEPLLRAASLWEAWDALDEDTREDVAEKEKKGEEPEPRSQAPGCAAARGEGWLAGVLAGQPDPALATAWTDWRVFDAGVPRAAAVQALLAQDRATAVAALKQSLAKDDGLARVGLALARSEEGDRAAADAYLRKVVALDRADLAAAMAWGEVLARGGKSLAAVQALDEAARALDNPVYLLAAAQVQRSFGGDGAGALERAVAPLRTRAAILGDQGDAASLLALALAWSGEEAAAREALAGTHTDATTALARAEAAGDQASQELAWRLGVARHAGWLRFGEAE